MRCRKLYVIGPVTGVAGGNRESFEIARTALADSGFRVLIPHDFVPPDAPWELAMRRSIQVMLGCEAVAEMPGVGESKGANLESKIARALGIPVRTVREWAAHGLG